MAPVDEIEIWLRQLVVSLLSFGNEVKKRNLTENIVKVTGNSCEESGDFVNSVPTPAINKS